MISWIQTTFQNHFRIIFAVLLALIVISFVFTIGASPGIGRAERRSIARPFFGVNLGSTEDSQRLGADASLSAYLQIGYSGLSSEQLQRYALNRHAQLALAKQLNLPKPSTSEITDYIKTLRPFAGENGQFDPAAYARFRDTLKANANFSEATVSRILADDFRIEQVQKLFAGPGYVLSGDVQQQLLRTETRWTLATATVDYASYQPSISPSETELGQYFASNSFRYQIAPKFSGGYVEIPLMPYLEQVNVTDEDAKTFFERNPMRFAPKAQDGKPAAAPEFDAVKEQVLMALRVERARQRALKEAADLTVVLYESQVTPASVGKTLEARKLTLKPIAPFTQEQGPAEFGGSPEVSEQAFKLNTERCFSDAIPAPMGAVILIWQDTLPARDPLLAEVRDRVSADYIENEKRKRFVDVGRQIKQAIQAQLKAGASFEAAAAAAASSAGVKIEAKTLPAFTLRQRPQNLDYSVYGTLENLNKGDVSDMVINADKGVLVHAADKHTPELATDNPEYVAVKEQLGRMTGSLSASGTIEDLIEAELKKSEPSQL